MEGGQERIRRDTRGIAHLGNSLENLCYEGVEECGK